MPSPRIEPSQEDAALEALSEELVRLDGGHSYNTSMAFAAELMPFIAAREKQMAAECARLREALRDISESDDIDNALDPARNKRVALAALTLTESN